MQAGIPGPDGWLNRTGQQTVSGRLAFLRLLVPAVEELHLRVESFERMMLEAGADSDTIGELHAHGWEVDVWTVAAGTEGWHARMDAAVAAGVDMITTTTAPGPGACVSRGLTSAVWDARQPSRG